MKCIAKYLAAFVLLLSSVGAFAQQNEEKQLRQLFQQLESARKGAEVSTVNDVPFHQLSSVSCSNRLDAIKAANCIHHYSSKQLHTMEEIFRLYLADGGKAMFALFNNNTKERLLDFSEHLCGWPHFETDTVINEVYRSYLQWWDTVKRHGLPYVRSAGISPTDFCHYTWHSILGHIPVNTIAYKTHRKTHIFKDEPLVFYEELKQILLELLDDAEQTRWFVDYYDLRERFPDYSDQHIVIELGILSLLNMDGITSNVSLFKLFPLNNATIDFEQLLRDVRETTSTFELKTVLGKHHIAVVLK